MKTKLFLIVMMGGVLTNNPTFGMLYKKPSKFKKVIPSVIEAPSNESLADIKDVVKKVGQKEAEQEPVSWYDWLMGRSAAKKAESKKVKHIPSVSSTFATSAVMSVPLYGIYKLLLTYWGVPDQSTLLFIAPFSSLFTAFSVRQDMIKNQEAAKVMQEFLEKSTLSRLNDSLAYPTYQSKFNALLKKGELLPVSMRDKWGNGWSQEWRDIFDNSLNNVFKQIKEQQDSESEEALELEKPIDEEIGKIKGQLLELRDQSIKSRLDFINDQLSPYNSSIKIQNEKVALEATFLDSIRQFLNNNQITVGQFKRDLGGLVINAVEIKNSEQELNSDPREKALWSLKLRLEAQKAIEQLEPRMFVYDEIPYSPVLHTIAE